MKTAPIPHLEKYPYRPEVDGIRALAVTAVIINHFNKELLPSGYLGVDIFFVISGFVITSSLAGRNNKNFLDFITAFYTRRIKRLVPALLPFVLITSIMICFFDPTPGASLKTGITSLFGLSNLYLLRQSTDYFAASTELNVFTHTWSLGVEEQFYFLFPFLFWFSGFGRKTARGSRHLILVTTGLSIASLITFAYAYRSNQPAAYFLMPTRLWELGSGCLLFLGIRNSNLLIRVFERIPPLMITGAVALAFFVPIQFAVPTTVAVVVLTVLLISCLRPGSAAYDLFTHPKVVYVGLISYSLYLWHWGVLSLSHWTIGIHWWSIPLQVTLMLLLSSASYRYIETPLRRSEWSVRRWQSIGYGLAASACTAIALAGLLKPLDGMLFTGTSNVEHNLTSSAVLARKASILETTEKTLLECNMTPHLLGGQDYRPQPLIDRIFIRNCISNSASKNKLLLVGDSFAQVSAKHLAVIAADIGYDFRMIYGYACPYPLRFSEIKSGVSGKCSEVDEELLFNEIISDLRTGDIVVLRLYLPKSQYLDYEGRGKLPPTDAYDHALRSLIIGIRSKGAKLVVIGANPTLSIYHIASIMPQWFNRASSVNSIIPSYNDETSYFHINDQHLNEYINGIDGASFFSLEPYLCNRSGEYLLHHDEKVLYCDNQHLTPYAQDLFFGDLSRHIRLLANSHVTQNIK